jgi:plasmid stability protein
MIKEGSERYITQNASELLCATLRPESISIQEACTSDTGSNLQIPNQQCNAGI